MFRLVHIWKLREMIHCDLENSFPQIQQLISIKKISMLNSNDLDEKIKIKMSQGSK